MLLKKKVEGMKKAEKANAPEKREGEEEGEAKNAKESEEKELEPDIKLPEIKTEDLDVFSVDDVADVGSGEPIFSKFSFEDWALLSIRYELHLLIFAFRKDLDDPDRPTFPQSHLAFYYNKYFKKQLAISNYGFEQFSELAEIIKDTVEIKGERESLEPQLGESTELGHFVKLTEDHRRDRIRRVDAGDESALLKFVRPQKQESNLRSHGAGKGGGKGGDKSRPAKRPWTETRDPPPRRDAPQRGGHSSGRDDASDRKRPWERGASSRHDSKFPNGGYNKPRDEPAWKRDEPSWKRQSTGRSSGGYDNNRAPSGSKGGKGGKGCKSGGYRR